MILLLTIKALSWLGSKNCLSVLQFETTQGHDQHMSKLLLKSHPIQQKKQRMNHKLPMLPVERLEGKEEEHIMTISTKRSDCKYCSYLRLLHKTLRNLPRLPVSSGYVQSVRYTFVKNTLLLIISVVQTIMRMTRWMSQKLFAIQLCRNVLTILTYIICRITITG